MLFAKMGSLQELGWQKRVRTRSCGDFNHSSSISQRRQSAPSLILSKALTKSKPVYRDCVSQVSQDLHTLIQTLLGPSRKLICQGNVLLQTGVQIQERYLLLFTDLLIITKAKSVMQVKQKACVRVSEMWTASCVDEVCEANTITERSFVIGWPTYNCVATFSTSQEKERWLSLIESCIKQVKKCDDPKIIPLEIFAKDVGNCDYEKTVSISNTECASDVINTALKLFGLSGGIDDYQLWVCSKKDETPYPLIGHEFPYSIKTSHMRSVRHDAVTSSHRQVEPPIESYCQFFLRPRQINSTGEQKGRKRRMSLISWAFKRGFSIEQDVYSESSASSGHIMTCSSGHLFGRPLSDVIKNNTLPSPIVDMLMCLCSEGVMTPGVFRRCAGVKACRELREKLDSGYHEKPLNEESVLVTAAVFKDFLRNIPGSLLCEELYELWLKAIDQDGQKDELMMKKKQLHEVQRLLQLLPRENLLLLRHVIAMLHHIELNAEHNQMNSYNLAVCIAPSCLWNCSLQCKEEDAKRVCDLIHFLIENCCALFGDGDNVLQDLTADSKSNYGSVGSLQQLSDSGYGSLKNEVNTDTEDNLKIVPIKDSYSIDSLMSLSDCDLDCPDDELETDRRCQKMEMPADKVNDNVLLEQSFQQLKLVSGREGVGAHRKMKKQTPPPLLRHDTPPYIITSTTGLSVNSRDSGFSQSSEYIRASFKIFQSPHSLRRNSADYQQPISLLNENLCLSHHQRDSTRKTSLSRTRSPPLYRHALLNRKPVSQTLTQVPARSTGQLRKTNLFYRESGNPKQSLSENHQGFPAPKTFKHTSTDRETGAGCDPTYRKPRTEGKVTLPESMFYGQCRKLTVHKVSGQNQPPRSGQQRMFKGFDALKGRSEKVMEKQADGRSRRLRRCISSQWVDELGFHSEESYV